MIKSIKTQPFIFATGLAALVHSTWSLATLFTGIEPAQFTWRWFAWLAPALLIAFALDIGQINTSNEIRQGHRNRAKFLTFAIFSTATYFLQWLYIVHHVPALALGEGVRSSWIGIATLMRDAAIWLIPAMLPASTLLYTFSDDYEKEENLEDSFLPYKNNGRKDLVPVPGSDVVIIAEGHYPFTAPHDDDSVTPDAE